MFSRKPQAWSFVAVIACAVLTPQPGEAGPTTSWVTTAVGSVTVPGSATTSPSGRMTVSGEGTDIWGGADGFQYLYQRLSGNMQISAKITGLQNTDGWAKAGLMIRQGLTAGSLHASLLATPSNGIVFQQRSAAGGLTTRSGAAGAAPVWLRLTRVGAAVTASVSSDGTTWADIGTASVPMTTDVMVGVAVTSRMPSRLTTASFDKVVIAPLGTTPATPPAGPVAAWSFDDGAGNLLRATVGGLDGMITGATWTTAGRHGGALMFNGVDQMVTVPANALLNLTTGMTLEAWVNPTSVASWRNVAMKEGSNDLAYALYASDASSKPQAALNMGAGQLVTSGTAPLQANTWAHLATTFDGSTHRLFVNGVQVGSVAAAGALWQTTAPFRIGGNSLWGGWFDGAIDDMRVYNRALSLTEIQTDMNTPVDSPPADTTPPNVAISTPVTGATVSGTVGVVATATDNVGVASVQFLLNGVNLGGAVSAAPYTAAWSTQAVPNGTYRLTAVARDHSGNANVSADVSVAVSNASPPEFNRTGGSTIYQAGDDFALVQGPVWFYRDSSGALLTVNTSLQRWQGSEPFLYLWEDGGHPGATRDAVRRWVAPAGGTAQITGSARDVNAGGGDGVVVCIRHGAATIWQATLNNGDPTGAAFDVTVGVQAGDTLDFGINRRANNSFDATYFNPTIVLTPLTADTTPPVLSNVGVANLTSTGATVSWGSDEGSSSQIKYGLTASYGLTTVLEPTLVTTHTVLLRGLLPGTEYHYRVVSVDAAGNVGASADATFTTVTGPGGGTIYQARDAFAFVQGPDWFYRDSSGALLTVNTSLQRWQGSEPFLYLWADGGHPGATRDAVRRWVAPAGGTAQITGSARDVNAGGGDGVVVYVRHGTATIWQATLDNGDPTGVAFDVTVGVQAGDTLDFGINRRANNSFDSTYFNPTLVLTVRNASPPDIAAGPVAAWSFDDGAGRLLQDSVGGLDGVITGATWTTAGRHGGALMFNGVDQMVTVPANALLNLTTGMTLEAWVNPTSVASWRNVAMKEGSNDLAYALYASDASSKPQAAVNMGAGQLVASGTAPLQANTWAHLATTFDGSTHRLFVNGVQVGSVAAAGALWQTTAPFRIGGNSLWGGWFDGAIDDMRVYNRALSLTEIQTDMNTPVDSPPADTTPPNVAISTPVTGATVSGTVGVVATATDNVGVASVQFLLNGVNLGGAVSAAPYTAAWSTQAVPNGTYRLTAVARDHSGNANVSADVSVAVSNASPFVIGRTVAFTSVDHLATLPDGSATISGYTLEVWLPGSNTSTAQPYKVASLGKPASTTTTITVDQQAFFGSLPKGQEFFATTTATGPGGSARSAASNSFIVQ